MEMLGAGEHVGCERASDHPVAPEIMLSAIIYTLPEAIFTTTAEGTITSWSPSAERLFGYSAQEITGAHISVLGQAGAGDEYRALLSQVATRKRIDPYPAVRLDRSGNTIDTVETATALCDSDGTIVGIIWTSRDTRELRRLESVIWEEKERAEAAFSLIGDALILTDRDGAVIYLNPAAEQLTGRSFFEARGLQAGEIAPLVHEESREPVESPVVACLRDRRPVEPGFHNMLLRKDDLAIPVEDAAMPVSRSDGSLAGAVLVLRPVGRARSSGSSSLYTAGTDELTGMLNRREFEHRLEMAMITAARDNTSHALMMVKVREFNELVDLCGPAARVELLKQVAVMLRTQIRDTDIAARTQDGEFAILLDHCPLDQGRRIAEQTRRILREFPFYWERGSHQISVQIGLIPITPDCGSVARMMQIASVVCQMAETNGIDLVHVLDASDINRLLSSRRWDRSRQIIRAFDEDRFRLYGQRIEAISADYGDQMEMLAHMLGSNGEVIGPATFIPAARRFGVLARLDRWVISSVFRMVADNPRADIDSWSINLSEESVMDPDFPKYVCDEFHASGAPPQRICFEIDETVALDNLGVTQQLVDSLRPVGYAFCLSNFGGNPHSLGYLRTLRADYLKLDSNLTRNLMSDPVSRAIVDGVVNVARVLGIRTIAGMVEDEDLRDILEILGVDYAQGYAIAEPIPIPLARSS